MQTTFAQNWDRAQRKFFAEGALFDQIYARVGKVTASRTGANGSRIAIIDVRRVLPGFG